MVSALYAPIISFFHCSGHLYVQCTLKNCNTKYGKFVEGFFKKFVTVRASNAPGAESDAEVGEQRNGRESQWDAQESAQSRRSYCRVFGWHGHEVVQLQADREMVWDFGGGGVEWIIPTFRGKLGPGRIFPFFRLRQSLFWYCLMCVLWDTNSCTSSE